MNGNTKRALEDFGEVWDRVCGKAAVEQSGSGLEELRGFIADEALAAAFYEAAARRFPRYACRLRQLAAEERGHLRALQGEHFLLEGETCLPPGSCPMPRGGLRALRGAYRDELAAAEAYRRAAGDGDRSPLAEVYLKNAADEERHAGILKEIILEALWL